MEEPMFFPTINGNIMSIPDLPKAELYAYLRTNKSDLISAKKDGIKFTESISYKPVVAVREVKTEATKELKELKEDVKIVHVLVKTH